MGKTKNNSLRLQQAVRSIFEDYRQRKGCLGHVYEQAACGCDNALQMWRGPKGDPGPQGPQGPKGDNAGSFLVSASFVVDPEGQEPGSYLELVLIDVAQQEQVVYVDLSELTDIYLGGNGISIVDMVVAAKLGAGLTFDNQGNITSAYQFCDGLDETSNVVKVKLDANNNILGFAGSGCKGLTATVNLTQAASGVALVLTGANGTVLNTIPLTGGTGITIQKDASGFTWLVDPSDLVSSTAGNNLSISNNKLYVGNSTLSYTVGDGVFTLTNASGTTSTVTLPTVVKSLERADMVCEEGEDPILRLTFKRDNGQNLYQDVDMSCVGGIAGIETDVHCDSTVVETTPEVCYATIVLYSESQYNAIIAHTSQSGGSDISLSDPSADFTTGLFDSDSSATAYAIGLEIYLADPAFGCEHDGIQYLSTNSLIDTSWFEPPAHPIPLADLISSGTDLVTFDTTYPYPFHVSIVDNQDDTYTFSLRFRHEETTLTTDLVVTNSDGTEQRVDMKPLLTKIGGKIENRPVGEPVPVPFAAQDIAGLSPDFVGFYKTAQDVCDDIGVTPSSGSADATSFYAYFTDANMPQYVMFGVYFVDESGQPVEFVYYTNEFDWDNCTDINCSISAMLEGDVMLRGFDGNTNLPIEGKVLYLHCESVFDEATEKAGYKFTFLQADMSPALCLEPSCDPCIDMSPLLNSVLGSVQGSFSCDSPISDRISFGVYYNGRSTGSTQYADFGGSLTIGHSNVSSFYLSAGVSKRGEFYIYYRSGSSTSDTITFASLSVGSEVTLTPSNTVPSDFPTEIHLVVTAIPGTNQATFEIQDPREPAPTFTLTSTLKSGDATEQSIDMSCILDIVDDKFGNLSSVATSGSFNDLTDTPTNHVTTDTDQDITGTKTFVGQKKIAFKQSAAGDKLGFTLFDRNGDEVGYLEYNPSSSGTVNNTPVMTLGNYATKAAERSYVGFRRYSSISGAAGAYNLLTPLIVDARTPFNLTTTYTNFYLLLGVSDGTNMYTVGSNGVLDLSAMIPTGVAHLAGAETFTGSKTFGAGVYGNAVAMSAGAIDVSAGTVFTKTIAANTTISFTNVPAAPATACVTLILTNGGAYTVTWPSSVKWNGGTAPTLTSSGVDILTFLTVDGGTTWYGSVNLLGAA